MHGSSHPLAYECVSECLNGRPLLTLRYRDGAGKLCISVVFFTIFKSNQACLLSSRFSHAVQCSVPGGAGDLLPGATHSLPAGVQLGESLAERKVDAGREMCTPADTRARSRSHWEKFANYLPVS